MVSHGLDLGFGGERISACLYTILPGHARFCLTIPFWILEEQYSKLGSIIY